MGVLRKGFDRCAYHDLKFLVYRKYGKPLEGVKG